MLVPILIFGTFVILVSSLKDRPNNHSSATQVQGNPVNLTSHLAEFAHLIRQGHRPNQWLVNAAVSEAYEKGDWHLAQTISNSYSAPQIPKPHYQEHRYEMPYEERPVRKPAPPKKVIEVKETALPKKEVIEEKKLLELAFSKITSPIDYVPDDDWRMFVEVSKIENASFSNDNSVGMFRQNRKRLQKLGIDPDTLKDPVEQYNAFETECVQLINDGKNLINQSVAMPISVDHEETPITMSGLLSVMRHAGVENAAKWLDSGEERNKFPHTTKAFKRSNGCF